MKSKMSKQEARKLVQKLGWDFGKDYHAQDTSSKNETLLAVAKLVGYRKPASASGSTARYFFYYLKKS